MPAPYDKTILPQAINSMRIKTMTIEQIENLLNKSLLVNKDAIPYYFDTNDRSLYVSYTKNSKIYRATYYDDEYEVFDLHQNPYLVNIRIDLLGINKKPRKLYKKTTAYIYSNKSCFRAEASTGIKEIGEYQKTNDLANDFIGEIQKLYNTKPAEIAKLLKELPHIIENTETIKVKI